MLHIHALWYFVISVIYPQGFHRVKFVMITPCFVKQQYFWNIAIQPAVGCYNLWVDIHCSGCSPPGKKSLWNKTIRPLGSNFSEILIKIHIFSIKKMHFNLPSGKCRPSCLSLNVLNHFKTWNLWDLCDISQLQQMRRARYIFSPSLF